MTTCHKRYVKVNRSLLNKEVSNKYDPYMTHLETISHQTGENSFFFADADVKNIRAMVNMTGSSPNGFIIYMRDGMVIPVPHLTQAEFLDMVDPKLHPDTYDLFRRSSKTIELDDVCNNSDTYISIEAI